MTFRWRPPYRALVIGTSIAVLLVALMLPALWPAPVDPDCFEWCNLDSILATGGISLVSLVWLAFVLAIAWVWRRREPKVSALAAIVAGVALVAVAAAAVLGVPSSSVELLIIVSMGLQLPPAWRLAGRVRPSFLGPTAAGVMSASFLVAGFAFVGLGTSGFGAGRQLFGLALLVFVATGALLAAASLRRSARDRPGIALIAAVGLLLVLANLVAHVAPGIVGVIGLLGGVGLALGWGWVGVAWLRATDEQEPAR